MAFRKKNVSWVSMAMLLAAPASHATLTWSGCDNYSNSEFTAVPIATRAADAVEEPMKMAFDLLAAPGEDAKGKVDVYFTERLGKVRKFDSKTGKVITLGTLDLNINQGNSSDGVLGIALDPAFKTNHFAYIYYTFISATEKSWRISRFTLNAANDKLDPATEAVVLKVPIRGGSKHPGGALQFDAYGDLWITTGNDYFSGEFPVWSSANTNDLRGKILRIRPTPDGKYAIPEGNLFKPGTDKALPEIYIMGNRNPYTLSLDPVRLWAMWGDIGPDKVDMDGKPMNETGSTEKTEEYNLATAPGNSGYPFFAGTRQTKSGVDAANPVIPDNADWGGYAQGLKTLPPAFAPIYAYKRACAITGPLYRYDGDLKSSVKFPPHFQRKWLVTDFNGDGNKITAFTPSEDGSKINAQEQVLAHIPLHAPLDMQFGPDGALYVNNYAGYRTVTPNTGLVRIEYSGSCRPAEPKLETAGSVALRGASASRVSRGPRVDVLQASGLSVAVHTAGDFSLEVHDLTGRPVVSGAGKGPAPVSLRGADRPGMYFLRIRTAEGVQVIKFVRE